MSKVEIELLKKSFEDLCSDTRNYLVSRLEVKRQERFSENFVILINNFNSYVEIANNSLIGCAESWDSQEEQIEINKLENIKNKLIVDIKANIRRICNEYDLKRLWDNVAQEELEEYREKVNSLNKEIKATIKAINLFKEYLESNKKGERFWYELDENLVAGFYKIKISEVQKLKSELLYILKKLIKEKAEESVLKLNKALLDSTNFNDIIKGEIVVWEQSYNEYRDEEYYNLLSDSFGLGEESYKIAKVDKELEKKYELIKKEFLEVIVKNKSELLEGIEKDFITLERQHTQKHKTALRELKNINSVINAFDSDTITQNIINNIPEVIFNLKDEWDQLEDEHYQSYKKKFEKLFYLEDEGGVAKFIQTFKIALDKHNSIECQEDRFKNFIDKVINPELKILKSNLSKYNSEVEKFYTESIELLENKERLLNQLSENKYKIDELEFGQEKEKIKKDATEKYVKKFKTGLSKYYTYALKKSFYIFDIDNLQFTDNQQVLAIGGGDEENQGLQVYNKEGPRGKDIGDRFYQILTSLEETKAQEEKGKLVFSNNAIEQIDELLEEEDFLKKVSEDLNNNFLELFEYISKMLGNNIEKYRQKINYYKKYLEFLVNGQKELFNSLNYATNKKDTLEKLIEAFESYLEEKAEVFKDVLFGSKEEVFISCFKVSIEELNEVLSGNQEKLDEKLVEAILKSSENIHNGQIEYFNNRNIANGLKTIYQEYDIFLIKLQNAIKHKIVKLQSKNYNPIDKYEVISKDWDVDISSTVINEKVEVVSIGKLIGFKDSNKAFTEFLPELDNEYKYKKISRLKNILEESGKGIKNLEGYLFNVKSEIERYKDTDSIIRLYYFLYALWWHNKGDIKIFINKVKEILNADVVSKRLLDEKSLYTIIQELRITIDINQVEAWNLLSMVNRNLEEFYEDMKRAKGIKLEEGPTIVNLGVLDEKLYNSYFIEEEYFNNYEKIIESKKNEFKDNLISKESNAWNKEIIPVISDRYIKNSSSSIEESIKSELESMYENYERGCSEDVLLNELLNYVSELKVKTTANEKAQLFKNTLLGFDKKREQCINWHNHYIRVKLNVEPDNYKIAKFKEEFDNWSKGYKSSDVKLIIKNELLLNNIVKENELLNQKLVQMLNNKKQNITKLHQKFLDEFIIKQKSIKESFYITPISNIRNDSKIIFNQIVDSLNKKEKLTIKWKESINLINEQIDNFIDVVLKKCKSSGQAILYKEYMLPGIDVMLRQYIDIFIRPSKDNLYNKFYETIKKMYEYFEMLIVDFKVQCSVELEDIVEVFKLEGLPVWEHFIQAQGITALDIFKVSRELELIENEEEARTIVNHWIRYHKDKLENGYLMLSKLFDGNWSDKVIYGIIEMVANNNKDDGTIYELSRKDKRQRLDEYLSKMNSEINEYFNSIGVIDE
jgi:hypothetical protein